MHRFEIHLVEHCNLNCQCCDNYSPLASPGFLNEDEFDKEMKQMSILFPEIQEIRLLGGEPLLHPNICFFLKKSREYFPSSEIMITTNAILLGRMSEEFWNTCNNNNIVIEYTFYPINLDYKNYREIAEKHNVRFIPFMNCYTETKMSWRCPVSFEKKHDKYEMYEKCVKKDCVTLKNGKLYPCTCVPNICHFNKYFNKNLEVTEYDYIDIYTHTAQDIYEFLSKPIPFCSYCDNNKNTQSSGGQIEWAQTKYNINEWSDDATFVLQNYVKPTFINVKNGCCNSSFFKHNNKLYLLARRTNYSFISGNTLDVFKFNCNAVFSEENIYSYNEHTKTYDFYKNVSNVSLEDRERYEVKGDEDFRIMNCDGKMLVNFTRVEHVKHFQGWGFSHLAEFDDELNVVNDFALPTDRFIEKNWQPIENKMYEYVYSYNPFSILNVKTGEWNVNYDLCLESICGSSPVIKYKGYYITIVHNRDIYVDKKRKNYFHYLILFDENLNFLKMSNPFKFFGCDIEFSTYMGIIDDKINILASVNDQLTYKFVLDDEIIEKILDGSLFDDSICENLYDELFFDALKADNSIGVVCFGTFSNNARVKKIALAELENMFIENDKYNLIKNILCSYDNHYVISMTTIPSRKKRIKDNIESILGQSWQGFYKYCINIDDNLSEEDYAFYESLKELDERIEINICDNKWRSCNKLLPTLKKYPDDVIITVDDDFLYPKDSIKYLIKKHNEKPDCIITHEINPIIVKDGKFEMYVNSMDLKLEQIEYGKYLSNCCLFPPHIFDGTDLFNYEKMMQATNGTHDELWFWVNSTIKGARVIGLNYVHDFGINMIKDSHSDGYQLCDINGNESNVYEYNNRIKRMYGDRLNEVLCKEKIEFVLTNENIYNFFYNFWIIREIYITNFILNVDNLEASYVHELSNFLKGSGYDLDNFIKKNK